MTQLREHYRQMLDIVNSESATFVISPILYPCSPIFNHQKSDSDEPDLGGSDSDEVFFDTDMLRPRRGSHS